MTMRLRDLLAEYRPRDEAERGDLERIRQLVATEPDPWQRTLPLHLTASALIVHPPTGRVLLRWHQRQQAWLQVGGHGDPGEDDPLTIALREAAEETGLADLTPWPDASIRHLAIVLVAPGRGEPAHEHADIRLVLATQSPEASRPENPEAQLRWLTLPQATELAQQRNLRESLARLASLG